MKAAEVEQPTHPSTQQPTSADAYLSPALPPPLTEINPFHIKVGIRITVGVSALPVPKHCLLLPPEDPAQYACLLRHPSQKGQGPASLAETHDCVSERVSICYNPGGLRGESP